MLDLQALIRRSAQVATGKRVVIAAPYDLPDQMCLHMAAAGVISGYVADAAPDPSHLNEFVAGWWTERRQGIWFLRFKFASTIILLGAETHCALGEALIREARRKRFDRILIVDQDGACISDNSVRESSTTWSLPNAAPRRLEEFCFESAFTRIFAAVGNSLRLSPDSFDSKRVLLIIGNLGAGGAERQAAYIAAGLARRRAYEVHVACTFLDSPADNFFRDAVEQAGAKVHKIPVHPTELESEQLSIARQRIGLFSPLGVDALFDPVIRFASIMREIRPALVHTWMDYCNVLAGIAAELVGIPSLAIGGRSVAPDNFPTLFQPYMRAGYVSLLQLRDLIFLNNSFAGAADYERWLNLPENRVNVIHNGFEFPDKASPGARELAKSEYGIPSDARVVGSIIRFSEEKQPRLFVDTARQLHAWDRRLRFLIFGDGPMRQEMIEYAAASGLADVLTMPGVTSNPWQSLAAMDVFLLTSRMEGLPNVLVEAQAAGVPVVCTGVGGMNETFVHGHTGYSIPEATASALAEAVYGLLQEPKLLKQMAENAEVHARTAFGIDAMLDQISKAYNEQSTRDALRIRKELAAVRSPQFQPRALRDRKATVVEICRP